MAAILASFARVEPHGRFPAGLYALQCLVGAGLCYRRFKWGEIVEDLMRDYIAIVVWVLLVYFLVALCNFYRQKKSGVLKHMERKMVNTQLRLD